MDIPLFNSTQFLFEEPVCSFLLYGLVAIIAIISFIHLSYISFFESEFFSLSVSEVAEVKISSDPKFKRLKNLSEDPLNTLGSVIVARYSTMVFSLTLSTLAIVFFLGNVIKSWVLVCLIAGTVNLLLLFIFAEFIPDRMVRKENPYTICHGATIISIFAFLFRPLVSLLVQSTGVVERRLESRTQRSAAIEDISDSLNMGDAESDEKDILRGVVNFGKTSVDEIMQPRVDIVDIDYKSDFETVLKIIRESEYSRLPVYDESIDYVKGILFIKDFLQYTDQKKDFKWQSLIREAYFVPENKKIDDLFKEFQQKHIHMAIVVDEFGGTSGIVTMEDIIEVIVGDICDEHDEEENQITQIDPSSYLLDGKLLLSDFYRLEQIDKDVFESVEGDADTLAGLILELKGYIPSKGEVVEVGRYHFEIVSDDKRRIKEVKLTIKDAKE